MLTDNDVITCNGQDIKGEKFIQIPLDKEQRACLLETILCSKQKKHECLIKVIDELDRHVRAEDPERYKKICLNFLVSTKCS